MQQFLGSDMVYIVRYMPPNMTSRFDIHLCYFLHPMNPSDAPLLAPKFIPYNDRTAVNKPWAFAFCGCYALFLLLGVILMGGATWSSDDRTPAACPNAPRASELIGNTTSSSSNARRLDGARALAETNDVGERTAFELMGDQMGLVVAVLVCCFAAAYGWLHSLKTCPMTVTKFSLGVAAGMLIVLAIVMLTSGVLLGTIFTLLMLALFAFIIWRRWDLIQLSANLMQVAASIIAAFPALLGTSALIAFICLVNMLIFVTFNAAASFNGQTVFDDRVQSSTYNQCIWVQYSGMSAAQGYFGLMMYWILGTLTQARLFMAAFVAGQYYFPPAEKEEGPTWKALKLACTKSAGSIAAAGMIIALVRIIRSQVRRLERQRSGSAVVMVLKCILLPILRMILQAIEMMTKWATAAAALTGQPYGDAGKSAWKTVKTVFIDGMVTDSTTSLVMHISSVAVAMMAGFITWLVTAAAYDALSETMTAVYGVFYVLLNVFPVLALVVGIVIGLVTTGPISVWALGLIVSGLAFVIMLFLSATVGDLIDSCFLYYSIDRANGVASAHATELHAAVDAFGVKQGKFNDSFKPAVDASGVVATMQPYMQQQQQPYGSNAGHPGQGHAYGHQQGHPGQGHAYGHQQGNPGHGYGNQPGGCAV